MLASVVIRTYNEERYLERLIDGVLQQEMEDHDIEIVIVDSGSTDGTLGIAEKRKCRITHIKKNDFTFGRSLNVGCDFANGEHLVFISGHCIPATPFWINSLLKPLVKGECDYVYGRQLGHEATKYSECRLFEKYYPPYSKIPQVGYFCNNANSAIVKSAWEKHKFNESLTGLEDMELAKRIVNDGGHIGYVSHAPVYHIHNESWLEVRRRYEREAYALKSIMPEVQFNTLDMVRYFLAGVVEDASVASKQNRMIRELKNIVLFRMMHYWGTWRGYNEHRALSSELKHRYFYPRDLEKDTTQRSGLV